MQRYCIQNISQTNQKWKKVILGTDQSDLKDKEYWVEIHYKTLNNQTLSCVVIKQINDKVLIIRLWRVSGEGAIEIIMVGSPGVLIVRCAGHRRRAGYRTRWAPDRKMKSFSERVARVLTGRSSGEGGGTSHSQYWSILFQIFRLVSQQEQIWQHLAFINQKKNPRGNTWIFKSWHYLAST